MKISKKHHDTQWFSFRDTDTLVNNISTNHAFADYFKIKLRSRKIESIGDVEAENILCNVLANKCMLDWKGITDDDGKQIKFSPELAEQVLKLDPEYRVALHEFAREISNFRIEENAEMGKS